ncbi:BQ5605_C018g08595 [Microbotryum silenes-dioicae]|uniref:BQ5605_C018g08595 protein n=1 Tax=Microbotryum silenes-dioicae TaxID=796604 RepID=A0A2X0NZU4_9BASI|nr:BQ5605_C018g08595 [Microbotryum silenes-dioicae]
MHTPLALAPPLYNLNSLQGTYAHEQALQQNTNPTYIATHQPDLALSTPAPPNYELPPGAQLDGFGTTEMPFKMDSERLVTATSAPLFDPDQTQWPLLERRTGLTPLESLPTGFSPWPAWQGGPGTPAWPEYQ